MVKRLIVWSAAALLFWLAWRQISWQAVWQVLAAGELSKVPLWAAINVAVVFTAAGRWFILIRPFLKEIRLFRLTGYRLAAQGISYFTPGPQFGGEPLQVWVLTGRHRLSSSSALATVTVDKLIELSVNFAVLLVGAVVLLQTAVFPALSIRWVIGAATALWIIPTFIFFRLAAGRTPISRVVHKLLPFIPKRWRSSTLKETVHHSEKQIQVLWQTAPLAVIAAFGITLVNWGVWLVEFWLVYQMIGVELTLIQLIVLVTAARAAFLMPIPAGMGTLEVGQLTAAVALGLPGSVGLSATLLMRGRDLIISGFGLWLSGRLITRRPKAADSAFPNNL